jgi:hypothetical protein
MKAELREIDASGWLCAVCGEKLRQAPVKLSYISTVFDVELPCCPKCGFIFIPPELAEGKMREAERILEDK